MAEDVFWQSIGRLQGRTLELPSGYRTFKVVRVDDRGVVIKRSRSRVFLPRELLQTVHALGQRSDALPPSTMDDAHLARFDPRYIVAILNAIEGSVESGQPEALGGCSLS